MVSLQIFENIGFHSLHMMMLYICTKFHGKISKGFRVIEQTGNHDGRTDVQTDGRMNKVITIWPPQTSSGGALILICKGSKFFRVV